ncbi:Rv3212 family protein [Mycolicibacterium arenosum]|uniref:PQQ-binding-like beta-propeller repeat protein n=1 Tax=Mycolicibacterium arenosum TaxID=2952157 RepID=A0ABT1M3Y6_9MYCO|nr:PQQ-binding-like beta-propeller repeat protein [Mycolicibacterium sp. CAU 1645]MCP9273878.1 PQQ-binding-like beta-propeller repeat protein [Mycolicibacterium sp. CAU 1645]
MVAPERRTRADLVAALAIVVVVAVAAALLWWTSDARATISRPAAEPVPGLSVAREVPTTLRELWSAPSPKTDRPVVAGGSIVTGDGKQVDGRDATSGDVLWSYARDRDLCGVTYVYYDAVAVYPDDRGCGQVTTLSGKDGKRGATRSSYSDPEVRLSSDGTTVLSYGDSRLEQWRSDMVRMLSWGALDARIKPKVPAQPICRLVSAAGSGSQVAVIESCPQASEPRLTLLRADKEEDEPLTKSVPLTGVPDDDSARVIAVSGTTAAVYVPTPKPTVNVIDEDGKTIASTLIPKPPSPNAVASGNDDVVTWWTGDSVMVFDTNGLKYKYTVSPVGGQAPVGPATVMVGKLLVPVTTGYDVFDAESGAPDRHIDVARPPSQEAVVPAIAGSTVLEQRGDTLVALG